MENPRRDTTNTQPPTHYPACTRRTKSSTSSPPNSVQVESATKALRPALPRVTQFILTIPMIRMTGCQLTFCVPAVNPNQNIPSVSEQTDDYPRGWQAGEERRSRQKSARRGPSQQGSSARTRGGWPKSSTPLTFVRGVVAK